MPDLSGHPLDVVKIHVSRGACVIDQAIDAPPGGNRCIDNMSTILRIRDVTAHKDHVVTLRRHALTDLLVATRIDDYPPAFGEKQLSDASANTTGRASHDDYALIGVRFHLFRSSGP